MYFFSLVLLQATDYYFHREKHLIYTFCMNIVSPKWVSLCVLLKVNHIKILTKSNHKIHFSLLVDYVVRNLNLVKKIQIFYRNIFSIQCVFVYFVTKLNSAQNNIPTIYENMISSQCVVVHVTSNLIYFQRQIPTIHEYIISLRCAFVRPVSWGCRIYWQHFHRGGKTPPQQVSWI